MLEQIAIGLFGVTAIFLTQDSRASWRRWACIFGLIGQPFWFLAAYKAQQWGILALCCLYTLSWARGFWTNWIACQSERDTHSAPARVDHMMSGYKELIAGIEEWKRDAERWRAFVGCARIRLFGWAGYGTTKGGQEREPEASGYRHFGGEFWTIHSGHTDQAAAEILTGFADAAIALAKDPKPLFRCKRCGKNEHEARRDRCADSPCPMDLISEGETTV